MSSESRAGIETVSILEAARAMARKGWAVVPVRSGQKYPQISGWPLLRLTEADLPRHFSAGQNIGVILGKASQWLADVDLDAPEVRQLASHFLPSTARRHGRASKTSSHSFYFATGVRPETFKDIDGTMLVELRSTGQQTLVPPSVHPSGESYAWESEGEPAVVSAALLRNAVARVASAALLARHWPATGSRHHAANAVAGMLLRAGWNEKQTARFVEGIAMATHDEEVRERLRDVVTTARRLSSGGPATGAPSLAAIVGDDVVRRIRQWLELKREATISGDDGWPDPEPLAAALLPVPAMDLALLPQSLRSLVEDISERMQAPPDYATAAMIVALAGCVNRRAEIIPKVNDTSWRVVPNLWGAIVAPPGMMKSPILRAVTSPLTHIESALRAEYDKVCSAFSIENEQSELDRQVWKEKYKQSAKSGKTTPPRPNNSLRAPTQRRLVLTDATVEKLHAILAENPDGVLVIRDELTGWLAGLDKQGREQERAFFLEAWNGDGAFTMDRIGRGSVHASFVCVSLLGNIQPSRLRAYLADAMEGGPTDDGLFQRFQIVVWPDPPTNWRLVDRPPNLIALETAARVCSMLANLSAEEPVHLSFEPEEAQSLFFAWLADLEHRIRGEAGLPPAFIAHLAKYRSLMPTLAGLFELADRAAGGEVARELSISLDHTRQAAAFCDYLEAHARRIYACVVSPETHSARELGRHLQSGDLGSLFTTRVVYLKGWAGLDTPDRVRSAVAMLEEAGWVRRADSPRSPSGGRPSEIWLVNPKVVHREK
jgi:hypothetical protein